MGGGMQNISLFRDSSLSDADDARRRHRLADMLQQQALQPLDANQIAGGYVVPVSRTQGLAKLLEGWMAGQMRQPGQRPGIPAGPAIADSTLSLPPEANYPGTFIG